MLTIIKKYFMPLRKPTESLHIPSTRKKNIEVFKNTTPQQKPPKIEYNCYLFFNYDKSVNKQFLSLKIESVLSFSSFNYEISTELQRKGSNIDIGILGLTTQVNNAPIETKASKIINFDDLFGELTINIIKYDGCENSCKIKFNLYEKNIEIIETKVTEKTNNRIFCNFVIAKNLNTFSNDI